MIFFSGSYPGTHDGASQLRRDFARAASDLHIGRDALDDLEIAIAELSANAVRHGKPRPKHLYIEAEASGAGFTIRLSDDGGAFANFRPVWTSLPASIPDVLQESGRGLWLIRNATDRVDYEPGAPNRWTLWRSFDRREQLAMLVIEDDRAVLSLYTAILGQIARVDAAASIAEARAKLTESDYDLIVADFHLGDGRTADLLQEADRGEGLCAPVIFVTADLSGAAELSGRKLGVHSVMAKPVRGSELRARATEAVAAHRANRMRMARTLSGSASASFAATAPISYGGLELICRAGTASAGGGDLFLDLGMPKPGRRRFMLADCMGHGLSARMHALTLTGLAHGVAHQAGVARPDVFLARLSKIIHAEPTLQGLVATVQVIDLLADGTAVLATAGHPAPLVINGKSAIPFELAGALPGLLPECGSRTRRLKLAPGQRLLMATDGFAVDSDASLAGISSNLRRALDRSLDLPLEEAAEMLARSLDAEQTIQAADDWTFILIGSA